MMPDAPEYAQALKQLVGLALAEDLGEAGDITSQATIPKDQQGAAVFIARQACTLSGMEAARETCHQIDPGLQWLPLVEDSQEIPAGAEIARLSGSMRSILAAERTAINFLAHLSGVATLTRQFTQALAGLPTRVSATRKTGPGMRLLEKKAVSDGGGETHRMGLYDAILIKDNHIAAAGGVRPAVTAAFEAIRGKPGWDKISIEVEVDTIGQLEEAIAAGAGKVLLDNMAPDDVKAAVELAAGRLVIEVSGGIDLGNARRFAEAGADIVSTSVITMSAPAIDFSLEVRE